MKEIKDILIVRLSKRFDSMSRKEANVISGNIIAEFKHVYKVIIIRHENKTDKTEFEIIKY